MTKPKKLNYIIQNKILKVDLLFYFISLSSLKKINYRPIA